MSKLYARFTQAFDPANPTGIVIAADNVEITDGFSELGYDGHDYDEVPQVFEVVPSVGRFVNTEEAVRIARAAGVNIFETHDEMDEAVSNGTFEGEWNGVAGDNNGCFVLEEETINLIIETSPRFRQALEDAGVFAVRDYIPVTNYEFEATMLWKPGTFELVGPLALAPSKDARCAQDVVLVEDAQAGVGFKA